MYRLCHLSEEGWEYKLIGQPFSSLDDIDCKDQIIINFFVVGIKRELYLLYEIWVSTDLLLCFRQVVREACA